MPVTTSATTHQALTHAVVDRVSSWIRVTGVPAMVIFKVQGIEKKKKKDYMHVAPVKKLLRLEGRV